MGFLLFPLALHFKFQLGILKIAIAQVQYVKYIVYTTLSSYEFRFYVFYTIETTWMIYMWAYKTVRTFLGTCNKPIATSLYRWAKHWAKHFHSIFFRMRDDYIPANYDCFVDNSKFCTLYLCLRLNTSNFHTLTVNLFIGLVNLLYIIQWFHVTIQLIVKEQILKHGNLSKNIKRYDDKVTFYKLWYLTVIYVINIFL